LILEQAGRTLSKRITWTYPGRLLNSGDVRRPLMSETTDNRRQQRSPLRSERGSTTISDAVVSQVAGIAAQEVEGVQMGGGAAAAVGGFLQSVSGGTGYARGVSVEVGEEEAAIDLTMAIEYGKSIPQVTEAVRRNVISRVENLVGLRVTEVNVSVADVQFREERPMLDQQQEVQQQAQEQERRSS
jgi:uncharacterized alkaline shock family protein YloU